MSRDMIKSVTQIASQLVGVKVSRKTNTRRGAVTMPLNVTRQDVTRLGVEEKRATLEEW